MKCFYPLQALSLFAVVLATWICLETSAWADERNDTTAGNWNARATWGTAVPDEKDTAVVDSHVVTLNVDLTGKQAPQSIRLSQGGTLVVRRGPDRTIACPITLDGGTWLAPDHWAVKHGSTLLTGKLNLTADTTFSGVRGTQVRIQGELSGDKKLRVTSSDAYFSSAFVLSLEHASKHTGGVELLEGPFVTVKVGANRALGTGPVKAHSGSLIFEADQDYQRHSPPIITVGPKAAVWMETERVEMPFVFQGGRITTAAGAGGTRELAGNMTLSDKGVTVSTARNRYMRLTGTIDGPGDLRTTKNDYYYQATGCTWTTLAGKNNTYSGGTQVNPGGGLQVTADRALGSGPIEVHGAGIFPYEGGCLRGGLSIDAQQNYPPGSQPQVSIKPGGAMYVNLPEAGSLNLDVTLDGGELSGAWREARDNSLAGTVTLAADSFLGGASGSLDIAGKITGPFKLTHRENAPSGDGPHRTLPGPVILSHPENDFRGGLDVVFGTLVSRHPGALGVGPIRITEPALLHLEKTKPSDWKLSKTFIGTGTVQVEDGSGRFRLIAEGAVLRPESTGTLTIAGTLVFPKDSPQRGVINTRLALGESGVTSGQLQVLHRLEQLSEGILNINIDDRLTKEELRGKTFEILRCKNDLTGSEFHAVSWDSGWTGKVEYGRGYVKLSEIEPVENILHKVTDPYQFGEVLGDFAPQFSTSVVGPGGLQLLREYAGREKVLRTHPVARDQPCILRAPVTIPAGKKTRLLLGVSYRQPQGDWRLIIKAGDQILSNNLISPRPDGKPWSDLVVDLSRLAGKKIVLEIHNHPTDWSGEDAYFSKIELVSD